MNHVDARKQLISLLRDLGVRTLEDRVVDRNEGFPLTIPLQSGEVLTVDLPSPGPLAFCDPRLIGVAVLDPLGYCRRVWGLANDNSLLKIDQTVVGTPLAGLLESSIHGSSSAIYLDGIRYVTAPLPHCISAPSKSCNGETGADVFVLLLDAKEEQEIRRHASRSSRVANALKRLGKVLSMNQTTSSICVSAAHEIASATELAAVAIWTPTEGPSLKLAASIGINRQGNLLLQEIHPQAQPSCIAEMVAGCGRPFYAHHVQEHLMTSQLEAQFCYLKPGGVSAFPLIISDRLLGVIELVAREEDHYFEEHQELFETFAEHLALALNAANMYELAEKRASHDALTGIANHRTMQEFLVRRLSEAERTDQEIGVLMLDVDHFRSFNEEEGHDAGDDVLKLVTGVLSSCVRPYDLAARYGGEEFTVVMPGSTRAATSFVAERIRSRIEEIEYVTRSGRQRHITVSIGCSSYPENARDGSLLLKAADTALFDAKHAGRNQVVFFEGSLENASQAIRQKQIDVTKWIHPQAELLRAKIERDVTYLAEHLPLSTVQASILEALLNVVKTYLEAVAEGSVAVKEMESSADLRLLLPALQALGERFDGTGPKGMQGEKIPLLARVLDVLLVVADGNEEVLVEDKARFDPEIVALMSDYRAAA